MSDEAPSEYYPDDRTMIRIGAALAIAFAIGVLVWLLFIRDDDDGALTRSSSEPAIEAHIVTSGGLADVAASLGHPVYWAGEHQGEQLELSGTKDGSVYVRYLTGGAEAGDDRPDFLTVGTYPVEDALGVLRKRGKCSPPRCDRPLRHELPGGGLLVAEEANPTSAYLAFPGQNFQIEIFDPRPGQALKLGLSGKILPVR